MKLLLDTHTFLWMSLDDPQLSRTARRALSDHANDLFLSAASYWEIAIKISIGKFITSVPIDELVNLSITSNGLEILTIEPAHAAQVCKLPLYREDPFDRMLVAQCQVENLPILSCDNVFDKYGIRRIW